LLKQGKKKRVEKLLTKKVVNNIKKEFGNKIQIYLIVKNIDGSDKTYEANIDKIDIFIKEKYTIDTLNKKLLNYKHGKK
jgi:hypothetical protein